MAAQSIPRVRLGLKMFRWRRVFTEAFLGLAYFPLPIVADLSSRGLVAPTGNWFLVCIRAHVRRLLERSEYSLHRSEPFNKLLDVKNPIDPLIFSRRSLLTWSAWVNSSTPSGSPNRCSRSSEMPTDLLSMNSTTESSRSPRLVGLPCKLAHRPYGLCAPRFCFSYNRRFRRML